MVPTLRERAAGTEEARRMLPETLAEFKAAGFFRILQPRRFGGFELGMDVLEEVLIEIARGCSSSAWTLGILSGHSWFAAMGFSEEGQRELYGDDGHAIISTTLSGRGVAVPVPGGYRISGRYAVQSGCDVANWHCIGAYLNGSDGASTSGFYCAVRPSEAEIIDNWFTLGMRGTGSKSVQVTDVFVPEHLALPVHQVERQEAPGSSLHAHNTMYRVPWRGFVFVEITGAMVGTALQAVDILDDLLHTKPLRPRAGTTPPPGPQMTMESPTARRRFAEAKSYAETARVLLLHDARRLMEMAAEYVPQGRRFSREESAGFALNQARVVDLCVKAVDECFITAGTTAAYTGQPMERCFRDMKMMQTHSAYRLDSALEGWATAHLGI
jgi:3-hydroxy-9,10-secoandrosta-1,3,5(10)-triene-9,17-dione monooxygenase